MNKRNSFLNWWLGPKGNDLSDETGGAVAEESFTAGFNVLEKRLNEAETVISELVLIDDVESAKLKASGYMSKYIPVGFEDEL